MALVLVGLPLADGCLSTLVTFGTTCVRREQLVEAVAVGPAKRRLVWRVRGIARARRVEREVARKLARGTAQPRPRDALLVECERR